MKLWFAGWRERPVLNETKVLMKSGEAASNGVQCSGEPKKHENF